jgi:hypothetical protein
LPLSDLEKANLRKHKIKIVNLLDYSKDELEVLIQAGSERVKEIYALAEFQSVPSIGIKFAEDLVFLGYYSLEDPKKEDGAKLFDKYQLKKGFWVYPYVGVQFRLVVNFSNTHNSTKTWYDFTQERKKFRSVNGYPASRPQKYWLEISDFR